MALAAGLGALNIVSGVFGALGLASFTTSFIPKPPLAVTQVSIAVGQTADTVQLDPDNLHGNIPAVKVFSVDGRLVGSDDGNGKKTWAAGSVNQVPLKNNADTQNVQSEYVALYATGTNAICIAAVGLKNPNSDDSFGFFGDVAKSCGMQWHISETQVGSAADTTVYRSPCVWITGDSSHNSIGVQGFSFHVVDFSQVVAARTAQYEARHDSMCNSTPRFSAWSFITTDIWPPFFIPSLQYTANGTDADIDAVLVPGLDRTDYGHVIMDLNGNGRHPVKYSPTTGNKVRRRSEDTGHDPFGGNLIITPYAEHSARELCESVTSYGPDVVSLTENLFCDMDYKQLWPLCSSNMTSACFDVPNHNLRSRSERILRRNAQKTYTTVQTWGQDSNST